MIVRPALKFEEFLGSTNPNLSRREDAQQIKVVFTQRHGRVPKNNTSSINDININPLGDHAPLTRVFMIRQTKL